MDHARSQTKSLKKAEAEEEEVADYWNYSGEEGAEKDGGEERGQGRENEGWALETPHGVIWTQRKKMSLHLPLPSNSSQYFPLYNRFQNHFFTAP